MAGVTDEEVTGLDALVNAARIFVGITAESVAQVSEAITLPQLRVLVLASSKPASSVSAVAAELDVHLSNATRICDRLVQAGLLLRRESPVDRRRVELRVTEAGAAVVDEVAAHRRAAIRRILRHLEPREQQVLADAVGRFAAAAEEEGERRLALL